MPRERRRRCAATGGLEGRQDSRGGFVRAATKAGPNSRATMGPRLSFFRRGPRPRCARAERDSGRPKRTQRPLACLHGRGGFPETRELSRRDLMNCSGRIVREIQWKLESNVRRRKSLDVLSAARWSEEAGFAVSKTVGRFLCNMYRFNKFEVCNVAVCQHGGKF